MMPLTAPVLSTPQKTAYRAGSLSADIASWVLARPERSWFRAGDIPVSSPSLAAKVLCEMTASGQAIERVAKGIYWRRGCDPMTSLMAADQSFLAVACFGPGTGFAEGTAVHRLGWTWNPPLRSVVSVAGRVPGCSLVGVRFVARQNRSRESLNWGEITLIEAVRFAEFARPRLKSWDQDTEAGLSTVAWRDALSAIEGGRVQKLLGKDALLRPQAIAETVTAEPRTSREFRRRMDEVLACLPPAEDAGVVKPPLVPRLALPA